MISSIILVNSNVQVCLVGLSQQSGCSFKFVPKKIACRKKALHHLWKAMHWQLPHSSHRNVPQRHRSIYQTVLLCEMKSHMMVMGINSIYICVEDQEWLLSGKIELEWLNEATSFSGQRHFLRKRLLFPFSTSPESVNWSVCKGVIISYWRGGPPNSKEGLRCFRPRFGEGQTVLDPLFTVHRRVVQAGCVIAYKECRWCSTT